ncbi:hypothetical protein OGAPHI_003014 [Ogataea philodendri]|uniref:Uncharacterized protein n=1 Tax=Ogataea philodendri TaxID=1378263 RepID=A0A9P8P8W6_9ASCO|nr:uncharacterized protein OGAPHI_003014 [Ogataea philodendri]KAH3667365.1 hypothetical protein OGAPHI_003014 [Ogataea philodendri]
MAWRNGLFCAVIAVASVSTVSTVSAISAISSTSLLFLLHRTGSVLASVLVLESIDYVVAHTHVFDLTSTHIHLGHLFEVETMLVDGDGVDEREIHPGITVVEQSVDRLARLQLHQNRLLFHRREQIQGKHVVEQN